MVFGVRVVWGIVFGAALLLCRASEGVGQGYERPAYTGPRTVGIQGRVIDEDAAGVGSARVELYEIVSRSQIPYAVERRAVSFADAEGRFRLPPMPILESSSTLFLVAVAEGYALGWKEAARYSRSAGLIEVGSKPMTFSGRVTSAAGEAIASANVHAVAQYDERDDADLRYAVGATRWLTVQTDGQGRFVLERLPYRARLEVAVRAEAYAPRYSWRGPRPPAELQYLAGQEGAEITLEPAAGILGRLVDAETSAPIAGERVFIVRRGENGVAARSLGWHFRRGTAVLKNAEDTNRESVTNEEGYFYAINLPPGAYDVCLDPFTNPDREWVSERVQVSVAPRELAKATLEAVRPGQVTVTAVSAESGAPVAELGIEPVPVVPAGRRTERQGDAGEDIIPVSRITWTGPQQDLGAAERDIVVYDAGGAQRILRSVTDVQGRAQFNLAPGAYTIGSIQKDGCRLGGPVRFEVAAGETTEVKAPVIVDASQAGVWGHCFRPDGQAAPDVDVWLLPDANNLAVTDPQGRFQMQPEGSVEVRGGAVYMWAVQPRLGFGRLIRTDSSALKDMRIELRQGHSLRGQVLDEANRPVRGASVTLYVAPRTREYSDLVVYDADRQMECPVCLVATDDQGRFEIPGVDAAYHYVLVIEGEGRGRARMLIGNQDTLPYREVIKVRGGTQVRYGSSPTPAAGGVVEKILCFNSSQSRLDLGRVRLGAAGHSVSGVVLDLNGRPVVGCYVEVSGDSQPTIEPAATDAQGRFVVDGLGPGTVKLRLGVHTFLETPVDTHDIQLVARDSDVAAAPEPIAADPGMATVEIAVVEKTSGRPIREASVWIDQTRGNQVQLETDETGQVRTVLPPGTYRVSAYKSPGFENRRVEGTLVAEAGQACHLELTLQGNPRVHGRAVGPDGRPVADAQVYFVGLAGPVEVCRTLGDGGFSFTVDRPFAGAGGRSPMVFVSNQQHTMGAFAAISEGEDLAITLRPQGKLTILTRDEDGQPCVCTTGEDLDGGPWTPPRDYATEHPQPGVTYRRHGADKIAPGHYQVGQLYPLPPGHTYQIVLYGRAHVEIGTDLIEYEKHKTIAITFLRGSKSRIETVSVE